MNMVGKTLTNNINNFVNPTILLMFSGGLDSTGAFVTINFL